MAFPSQGIGGDRMPNLCVCCGAKNKINRLGYCPACYRDEIRLLKQAIAYIRTHGRKSVFHVADCIGVSPARIYHWIEIGFIPLAAFQYLCPQCHQDLLEGICDCGMQTVRPQLSTKDQQSFRIHSNLRVEEKRRRYWEEKSGIQKRQKRDIWIPTK